MSVTLNINGKQQTLAIEPRITLRERAKLTDWQQKGCDHGQCEPVRYWWDGQRYTPPGAGSHAGERRLSPLKDWQGRCAASRTSCVVKRWVSVRLLYAGQICASVALLDEVKRGASAVTADLA